MRICFLSRRYFPAISGMSVYAQNLLEQLSGAGHDVVMVSQYRADPAGAAVYGGGPPPAVDGVAVLGLESVGEAEATHGRPADFERDIEQLVQAVIAAHREKPFDVIHAQYGYPTGLAAMEASRRLGIPNVVSIQGGDGHWVGSCCSTHRDAMRAVLDHAGALLIGSRSFAEEVQERYDTPLQRFTIIPGATDTRRFRPRADRQLGELSNPPCFVYHGRVDFRKGVGELLQATAEVVRRRPAIRVIVSGIGPDLEAAQERARKLELDDAVRFSGYTDYAGAPAIYRKADVFVSPTYSEGFSNTILEAMSSGLPVISTATVGVVDCLTDGRNGILTPVRDAPALAAAMLRLLDDAELRRRVAETALEDVRTLYSWPVIAKRITDVYESLVDQPIDTRWTDTYDPATTLAAADDSCRFRQEPHLL